MHRIVYQSDTVVISACGQVFYMTRELAREAQRQKKLTLRRGEQTCPDCGDYDWPLDVIRPFLLPKNPKKEVESVAMVDLNEFRREFTDRLLAVAAESRGVMKIEATRRYHTDPKFQSQLDTIVQAAIATLLTMEHVEGDPLADAKAIFTEEAAGLLGWDQ